MQSQLIASVARRTENFFQASLSGIILSNCDSIGAKRQFRCNPCTSLTGIVHLQGVLSITVSLFLTGSVHSLYNPDRAEVGNQLYW